MFDWRAFEASDYAQYCTQLQDGMIFSGDYIGVVRFGNMACDMTIYSPQQDRPIREDGEAHLTLSFYVGGVDTGYAYGRNGYPYDYVESMDFRFDNDMSHLAYEKFQDTIEYKIVDLIPAVKYDKADLASKACGKLHVW